MTRHRGDSTRGRWDINYKRLIATAYPFGENTYRTGVIDGYERGVARILIDIEEALQGIPGFGGKTMELVKRRLIELEARRQEEKEAILRELKEEIMQ